MQNAFTSGSRQLSVGIVLPVFNEAKILNRALDRLCQIAGKCPVVIVDGGSTDGSAEIAGSRFQTEIYPRPNRAGQMNAGSRSLQTDVLLFLHADSELPIEFQSHIGQALVDPRVVGGCFQLKFDASHPMLRFYSWCTRFSGRFLHFGDQAFFVRRAVFEKMKGYRELQILEDVEFLRRLLRYGRFAVLPVAVVTSSRRFLRRGILRQQLLNILMVTLFELGVPARSLARFYPNLR